jgi:hypothetical protein
VNRCVARDRDVLLIEARQLGVTLAWAVRLREFDRQLSCGLRVQGPQGQKETP